MILAFEISTPLLFSILFVLIILIVLFFLVRHILNPITQKHALEKAELELKNTKLMALFAELNPDPLLRVNESGQIIYVNKIANELSLKESVVGAHITDILKKLNGVNFEEHVKTDSIFSTIEKVNEKDYSIVVKGISYLNIAQIYLHDVSDRIKIERELQVYQEKLRELAIYIETSAEVERKKIAENLHDNLGQQISLLKLHVQKIFETKPNEEFSENFSPLLASLDKISHEIRSISHELKPIVLKENGFVPAIKSLVDSVTDASQLKGTLTVSGSEYSFGEDVELILYRICQEMINNIIKHACAERFEIQLIFRNNFIKLLISDNGKGFDSEKIFSDENINMGLGLFGIREKINRLNGEFTIESTKDEGTVMFINLPTGNK